MSLPRPRIPPIASVRAVLAIALAVAGCSPRTVNKASDGWEKPQSLPRMNAFAPSTPGENHNPLAPTPFYEAYASSSIPWQPWNQASLDLARANKRPLLVHIGHSTCPFSRRLRETALQDPALATFLGENFVCVLLDAEENPALNKLLLSATPLLKSVPAWPALIWLDPAGKPFYAHNFLKADGFTAPALLDQAKYALKFWHSGADFIGRTGDDVLAKINPAAKDEEAPASPARERLLSNAYLGMSALYNDRHGTVSGDRNFLCPTSTSLFLALADFFPPDDSRRQVCLDAAGTILRKIREGAIRDPLDHAFQHYSEPPTWDAPHSEKLLEDQALMAMAYIDAAKRLGDESFARTAFETLDALLADWRLENGLFMHAKTAFVPEDFTGPPPFLAPWYHWSASEVQALLDPVEWSVVAAVHGIRERGNLPPGPYSRAFMVPPNVLGVREAPAGVATTLGLPVETVLARLDSAHGKLRAARAARPGAFTDDRQTLRGNALVLSAMSRASGLPGGERFAEPAASLFKAIKGRFSPDPDKLGTREIWQGKKGAFPPIFSDYACFIQAALDQYDATRTDETLELAVHFQDKADQLFHDARMGAYQAYPQDILLPKCPPWYILTDEIMPSDNALALSNLRRLKGATKENRCQEKYSILQRFLAKTPGIAKNSRAFLTELAKDNTP